jgi:hypothetical protein
MSSMNCDAIESRDDKQMFDLNGKNVTYVIDPW